METKTQTDDFPIGLVDSALNRPDEEREAFLRQACGADSRLFSRAWSYVQWEIRMQNFLAVPLRLPSEAPAPFRPGQVLGNRFRIVREVARGGMGIVWEAIDNKLGGRVALKCPKPGFGEQLPPEVWNARQVSHPNVCKIFEIHTAAAACGDIDFISMEFLEGETLRDRLAAGPLPGRAARVIAQQLCAGLAEAHSQQVIHDDLKPHNVILTQDFDGAPRAVITDFGLARRTGAAVVVLGGTPAYMAPELWKKEKPSIRSDIYALGVMLWEIHTGLAPADLGVSSSTLPFGERTCWTPPKGRGRWDRIIARCIHPDPARRFATATEVAKAFGPSRVVRLTLGVAATLVLAGASGLLTYQGATAPKETARLALLPADSAADQRSGLADVSNNLLRKTADQLSAVKSSQQMRYRFISFAKTERARVTTPEAAQTELGATHSLRATVERDGQAFVVHAYVTDLQSGVDVHGWKAKYQSSEMRYAPVALAAVVTETLHLPPPTGGATVNQAAQKDYDAGLKAVIRDNTVDEALKRLEQAVAEDRDSALT